MDKNLKTGYRIIIFSAIIITCIFGYRLYENRFNHYYLTLILPKAKGLEKDNDIRYLGVKIGKVVEVGTKDNSVTARIRINKNSKIPVASEFEVDRSGLFSDKVISVHPSSQRDHYKPNDTVSTISVDTLPAINLFSRATNAITNAKNRVFQQNDIGSKLDSILLLLKEIKENQEQ